MNMTYSMKRLLVILLPSTKSDISMIMAFSTNSQITRYIKTLISLENSDYLLVQ